MPGSSGPKAEQPSLWQARYVPDEQRVEVAEGQTLLEASMAAQIPLAHACGGNARCSTCRVMVLDGLQDCTARTPEEEKLARHLGLDCSVRLACQTRISGDVSLRRLVLDSADANMVRDAIQNPTDISSGEEKTLAILFADLAGFTTFSENLPPYDVIHTLNRYYHDVGRIIGAQGGMINSYAGDGFMALFGLHDETDAAYNAVKAGLKILGSLDCLAGYLKPLYGRSVSVRVGIHYGTVVAGDLGTGESRYTTVIGDAVNFASRVEAANKAAKTRLLVSREVHDLVRERVASRPIPDVKIAGKSGKYELFEILQLVR